MSPVDLFNERQYMQKPEFEIFMYRDSYLNDVALHHHDFYELYLFLSGNVTYSVESRNYTLQPGDLLMISPMELHRPIIAPAKEPYERIVLWVESSFFEKYRSAQTNLAKCFDTNAPNHTNLLRLDESKRAIISDLMNTILYENSNKEYGSKVLCLSALLKLMVTVNRLSASGNTPIEQNDKSAVVISNLIKYINEHYYEDLCLDELANKFFVSKYHLAHEFNRLVGTSVYRFIIQKRLIIAKQLLIDGLAPTAAYEKCGFGDYANFYRSFKAEYGISPKQFAQKSCK